MFVSALVLAQFRAYAQSRYLVDATRDETITSMQRDALGKLYFSTLRGLSSYDGRDIDEIVVDENVNDFLVEENGVIWFCGQYYIGKVSLGRRVERFIQSFYSISNIVSLPGERLAFVHDGGISIFDKESLQVTKTYSEAVSRQSNLVFDSSSKLLWLASERSVKSFDDKLNLRRSVEIPDNSRINAIVPAKADNYHVILATSTGLYALDTDCLPRNIGQGLIGSAQVFFVSSSSWDGFTVAAVEGKGLYRIYDDLSIEKMHVDFNVTSETVLGFLMDRRHLWVSPDNSGVHFIPLGDHSKTRSFSLIEEFFSHKKIEGIGEDSRHGMWSVAGGTVYRLDQESKSISKVEIPHIGTDGYINNIFVTSDDRLLAFTSGTIHEFDISFDPSSSETVSLGENVRSAYPAAVYSARELPGGEVVLQTFNGIYSLSKELGFRPVDNNSFPKYSNPRNRTVVYADTGKLSFFVDGQRIIDSKILPENEAVNLAFVDHKNDVWCLTDNFKLYRVKPFEGVYDRYEIPQWQSGGDRDAINPLFHSIQEDDGGNIWIGTSYGLVKIEPDDCGNYSLYNTGRKHDYYTSSFKDLDGNLYFAYSNGISVFDPSSEDNLVSNADIRFALQLLLVNNVPHNAILQAPCEFRYTDNTMTFICSYVDYDNLQTRFAWKLEGYDENWSYNTEKYASYPNLPHGNYTFHLKMEGMPDSMAKSYSFVIRRKPWTSPTAISFYALLVLAATFFVLRYYWNRKKRQEKERMMEMTRQVDRMKLDVFTNLSHEFRTPLTLISVPLKDMLYDKTLSGEPLSKLRIMQRNVEKLQRLTDQLLEYDRIDSDFSRLDLRRKDVVRDLSEIAENFQYTALKSGSSITVTAPDSLEFVYDEIKVGRIMSNLLSNAIKYSPDGGEINISASIISSGEAERVYCRAFNADCLEIIVSDQGQGIPAGKLESVFSKYSRADESGYSGIDGFGIGLHYTRQLVQAHGGSMKAEQNLPAGSVFRFVMPDNLQVAEIADSVVLKNASSGEPISIAPSNDKVEYISGLNILVVEDNDDMRQYIIDMLRSGNNVAGASDGQKGLEAVKSQYFDIVISDVMMPVMDGYELCREIRSDTELCAMSIVLLTAKTDTQSQVLGLDLGADAYISKPFDPMYFRAVVNSIARRRLDRQGAYVRATSETIADIPEDIIPDNAYDRNFMKDLYAILDKHLIQEEIDINAIVQDIGMSRTGFYMKVKALTGRSPLQLVNEYRMSKAADLLKSGKHSIKEVAFMVGYQERRSFTSRFKATFGHTPTEFLNQRLKSSE
ncbi:MAG: response regulator [Bacteroidota bacterium]|nr:response regulator [Bacteroidota bacterium]